MVAFYYDSRFSLSKKSVLICCWHDSLKFGMAGCVPWEADSEIETNVQLVGNSEDGMAFQRC